MNWTIILRKIIVTLLLTVPFVALSQNINFNRNAFPNDRAGLREATKNLKTGQKLFLQGGARTAEALPYFLKANEFNPNNALLNYLIGQALLQTTDYADAIPYLEKAKALDLNDPDLLFVLGEAHQLTMNFQKAIENYQRFRQQLNPQELAERRELIDKRIAECQHGILMVANPQRVFVDRLPSTINSPFDDYSPVLMPGENRMFITSRRPVDKKPRIDRNDFKYHENILIFEKLNSSWEFVGLADKNLNRKNHSSVVAVSPDGNTMILYYGDKGGELFISELKNDRWSKPSRLPRTINSRHLETSATISADGNTLYFISNRPGGYGGKDIWFSTRDRRGRWQAAINLGPVVNTEYDEEALFLTPDGKTLYFSSKGHNSMGGFDIFKTSLENGQWTEPVNLGYPINGPTNDLFFRPIADGQTAYFSSFRSGGDGGIDIFMATFMGPEKPPVNKMQMEPIASRARPNSEKFLDQTAQPIPPMTLLRGKVFDDGTGEPLLAQIELFDNEKEELLATFATNPETGAYFISLPGGRNFGISVKAEDFLFHSENINVTETNVFTEIINDIRLKRVEVGTTIVLRNIFFDTGSANLRPESYAELGVLYKLLADNPRLKIEVSGHTDNVGSASLNQRLSQDRARSVVNFLTERGIAADRLTYKGYGFSRPVATNDTAEGRQLNRRTEFEIIEK